MERWCGPFIAVVLLSMLAASSVPSDAGPDLTAEQPFGPDGLETPLPICP